MNTVSAQKFSFVLMTDIHYTKKYNAPKAFEKVIDTVNKMQPDFVLFGGDMIYDALRVPESEAISYAKDFSEAIKKINAPKYYAVGNHEHYSLYGKNPDTTNVLYGKKYFEYFWGKRYYSFDYQGWHFITLDNILLTEDRKYKGKIDSLQVNWLKKDLSSVPENTPIAILVHVPLITTLTQWYEGGTKANDKKIAAEDSEEILKLFKNKNLRLILQGHLHYFEALNIKDRTLIITAPSVSGRWWQGKQHDVEEGFIRFKINGDKISYDYIDYGWEATPWKE